MKVFIVLFYCLTVSVIMAEQLDPQPSIKPNPESSLQPAPQPNMQPNLNYTPQFTQEANPKPTPEAIPQNTELALNEWIEYKTNHSKMYEGAEDAKRLGIYLKNKAKVEEHNERYKQGLETYEQGFNQFSDMEHEEFVDRHTGYRPRKQKKNNATHTARRVENFNISN